MEIFKTRYKKYEFVKQLEIGANQVSFSDFIGSRRRLSQDLETNGDRIARAAIEHGLVEITTEDVRTYEQDPGMFDPPTYRMISFYLEGKDLLN